MDVLYAEDDESTAEMIKETLERHEFNVRIVSDGIQAWNVFRCSPPDLLLLDLGMPKKDGLEIVRLVCEKNRRVPIVFYSAYMNVAKELEAIKLGADDCIHKGVPSELLLEKLRSIYRRITRDEKMPHIYSLSESSKFNAMAGLLTINGKRVPLKSTSARLLHLLCVKMHEVSDNEYLLRGLWGEARGSYKDNALRKEIKQLREILEADLSLLLRNSYGEGYVLTTGKFS